MIQAQMNSAKSPEILPLTGLRCFAALFVCIAHCLPRLFPDTEQLSGIYLTITQLSAEGMTLFFVLSGFVIHYNYSKAIIANPSMGILNFLAARFARLWPLYLLCLFLDLILNYVREGALSSHFLAAIPYYLTLTQSWFYHPLGDHALVYQFGSMPSVSWSISTEWFFYLVYPMICFGLYKSITLFSKIFTAITVSLITMIAITVVAQHDVALNQQAVSLFGTMADMHTHSEDSFLRWLIYFSPYSRVSEFIIGCTVAAVYLQLSKTRLSAREEGFGLVLAVLAILSVILTHYCIFCVSAASAYRWLLSFHQCFGFAPSFAILIFTCARYQNVISRFFSYPILMFGGEISYSMYLFHPVIIGFGVRALARWQGHPNLKLVVIMAAIIAVASLSYRWIEAPARGVLRRWLMARPQVIAA